MIKMQSLDGASDIVKCATKAEMEFAIFQRMDWSTLDRNQADNFRQFVGHAVAVVCDAIPEFVIPCRICIDAIKMQCHGTVTEDGNLIISENADPLADSPESVTVIKRRTFH